MTGVDAGSIYTEIRIALDKLQGDITQMNQMLANSEKGISTRLQGGFAGMQRKMTDTFKNISKTGVAQFAKMAQGISAAFTALPVIGLILAVVGVIKKLADGVAAYFNKTTEAYQKQQKTLVTLQTVVQTTGATAWTTAGQLEAMAQKLGKATGQSTNDIMEMQTRLLTYNNIVGENFNRAQKAALDMAAVMGMDVRSAAETLGKALDSPLEGLSALTKQGFRFKGELKEQIEVLTEQGKVSEAQALILQQVETAYKGAAEAAESASGSAARLKNLQEELDAAAGKTTSKFIEWVRQIKISTMEARLAGMQQRQMTQYMKENAEQVEKTTNRIDDLKNQLSALTDSPHDLEVRVRIITDLEREEARLNALRNDAEMIETTFTRAEQKLQEASEITAQTRVASNEWAEREIANARLIYHGEMLAQIEAGINAEKQHFITRAEGEEREARDSFTRARRRLQQLQEQQAAGERNIENLNKETAERAKLAPLIKNMTDAENRRAEAIALADVALANGRITQEEYEKKVRDAYGEESNQLTVIRHKLRELKKEFENNNATIAGQEAVANAIEDSTRKLGGAVTQERMRRQEIERTAAAVKAENIIEVENANQVKMLQAQRYGDTEKILALEKEIALANLEQQDHYKNLLSGLKEGTAEYEKAVDLQNKLKQSAMDLMDLQHRTRAGGSLVAMLADYQKKLKETGATAKQMLQMQREEALKAAAAFSDMGDEYKELVDNINEYYDKLEKQEAWKAFADNASTALNQVTQLFSAISDAVLAFQKRDLDSRIAILEEQNIKTQEALDEELQMRLYAAGLAEAATKKQYEQEVANAMLSGNHRLIYEAKQAQKRFKIEEEINKKKEEEEKRMQNKIAQLEYEHAMTQWRIQLATGAASAAQSILSASTMQPWPVAIAAMAIAAGVGAAQMAAIAAAQPPSPKKFDTGGIVRGNPYRGDSTPVMAKGKEMFLTEQDQTNLFDMIRAGGGGQPVIIQTVIELDGEVLAERVFEIGSLGNSFIRARGVVR